MCGHPGGADASAAEVGSLAAGECLLLRYLGDIFLLQFSDAFNPNALAVLRCQKGAILLHGPEEKDMSQRKIARGVCTQGVWG